MGKTFRAHGAIAAISTTLFCVLASPAPHAHSLRSPAVVQVARDASFDFEAIFRIGPGDERLSMYSVIGVDNVGDIDYDADGRCFDLFSDGEEIPIRVGGGLIDPSRSGQASIRLVTCGLSGPQTVFEVEIEVAPYRGNTIFWAAGGALHRASFEGENIREVLASEEAEADYAYLALDPIEGRVLWTSRESFSSTIRRAGLFGQEIQSFGGGGKNSLGGLAVDLASRTLYSADPSDCVPLCGSITRLDIDGTNASQLISRDAPAALDASAELDTMCWSDEWNERIECSNLAGNELRTVVEGVAVEGIALDPALNKVFWADWQAATIRRADTDGSNVDDLLDGDDGLVRPRDLAVDPLGRKIYWSDRGSGAIRRANLDGSDVEDVLTGLSDPAGIALLFGQGTIEIEFDDESLRWTAVPGARKYDVIRGSLQSLHAGGGDFAAATHSCAANSIAATELDTSSSPPSEMGTWWLVRGVTTTGDGTYGSAGLAQSAARDEQIAASGNDCP